MTYEVNETKKDCESPTADNNCSICPNLELCAKDNGLRTS